MEGLHRVKTPVPFFQMWKIIGKTADQPIVLTENVDPKVEYLNAEGGPIAGVKAVTRLIVGQSGENGSQGPVDTWLDTCEALMPHVHTWVAPAKGSPGLDGARAALEEQLSSLEGILKKQKALTGAELGLSDAAVGGVVLPLWTKILGVDEQGKLPATTTWIKAILAQDGMAEAVGDASFCTAAAGWTKLDPDAEAKKRSKLVAKEAKLAKFLEKQAKAKAKTAAPVGGDSKKAKAKAEAEAKKAAQEQEKLAALAAAKSVAPGAKKDTSQPLPGSYYPAAVEAGWYAWWEAQGYFVADNTSDKPPYVMVIPPPNVTGVLHIGHALTGAIEDTLIRWKRMCGYNVLWVPGTDHAGIATQTVVEKHLAKTLGKSRHDLGREEFLKHVWKWVDEHGGTIQGQLRRMGQSVDWSRYSFTLDDKLSRAVMEAFVRMYEEGLIYRANRLVNWCCRLRTALSDIEVDYIDVPGAMQLSVPGYDHAVEFGVLTSFAYKLVGDGGEVVVATTRPETMLGDTAVAVHPDDVRYKHLHGKRVQHPFLDRQLPIITDAELVDMAFGTGCVKITPAHDPNDFEVGKRHQLDFITVFDDLGFINAEGGRFQSMPRFKARTAVVEALKEAGLYRGKADNPMRLGLCSRSKDVIEPLVKPQWWVACDGLAAEGVAAVRDGRLQITPALFKDTWFDWLENIRDWCISRQLWWGHRIPAINVLLDDETTEIAGQPGFGNEQHERWVVGRNQKEALKKAQQKFPGKKITLQQDEDVLDTWFSSGLFPFSVLGWPDTSPSNKDLAKFYPNAILETGWDILFFWVARMVMMGMKLMGDVPFKDVFLHAMVRDQKGEKMSKSKGNVIDPTHVIDGITLEELHATLKRGNLDPKEMAKGLQGQKDNFPDGIEECGADALRFALVAYTSAARDINLDIKRVVGYRRFCNKLWNAVKFGLGALPPSFVVEPAWMWVMRKGPGREAPLACRYILSRLTYTVGQVNSALSQFHFAEATSVAYSFWWDDFCDLFIELSKPVFAQAPASAPSNGKPAQGGQGEANGPANNGSSEFDADHVQDHQQVTWICLDEGLRLLHPFMPFVTEELWQRLPSPPDGREPSICISPYPQYIPALRDEQAEADMKLVSAVTDATRQLRAAYELLARHRPPMYLACTDEDRSSRLGRYARDVQTLTGTASVEVLAGGAEPPKGCGTQVVDASTTVYLHLAGLLDPAKELGKLAKRREEVAAKLQAQQDKMAAKAYERTPDDIRAKDEAKVAEWQQEVGSIETAVKKMQELQAAS